MKNICITLIFTFIYCYNVLGQTLVNNKEAVDILKKSILANGEVPNSIIVDGTGNIHYLGHYEIPQLTKNIPLEESFAYFNKENVTYLRSFMKASNGTFAKVGISKGDSTYFKDYYDEDYSKTTQPTFQFNVYKAIPIKLLSFINENSSTLRLIESNSDYYVLSFNNNETISIYINKITNLVDKIDYLGYHDVFGDVIFTSEYKDYVNLQGIKFPTSRIDYEYGIVAKELAYSNVKINIKPDTNDLKIGWVPIPFSKKLINYTNTEEELTILNISENLNVLKIVSKNNKVLIAQLSDGIAIFESPQGVSLNQEIIAQVKIAYPNQAIKYLFLTHHHPDHAGGIWAYKSLSLTLVTTAGNKDYFDKLLNSTHEFRGSHSNKNLKNIKYDFVPIDGQKVFDNDIFAYEIGKSTNHTNEHLVYYFSKSKILWIGDLLQFREGDLNYSVGQRGKSVYDLIVDKNLIVDKIYTSWPLHNQKEYGTLDELKKLIEFK